MTKLTSTYAFTIWKHVPGGQKKSFPGAWSDYNLSFQQKKS
jgi:hypothetical protein